MINIRLFRQTDTTAVVKLWQVCGLTRPWNNPQLDIERKCALNDNGFVVMEEDGSIIGSVMFGYDGHRGNVYYLAIHPDYQRQRLGHQLMAYVEKQLSVQDCPKINLMVRSDNQQVMAFYQSLGYETSDVAVLGKRLIKDD